VGHADDRRHPSGSYRVDQGRRGVLVGIIDSGIDASHPDIAPNFNRALSRNFVTDIPLIDGACEVPSCVDPPDVDDNGHGTHVAGIVAAALNGRGVSGVAPKVQLVNIRGGQDGGFLFLGPTVDAMVYAGLVGIDVINMSFFTDPWLYNCLDNPADSPEAQAEQRTIRVVTQRAINFAPGPRGHPVGALGNQNTDLGDHAVRAAGRPGRDLLLLPVPAGDLDGVAARRRGGGADRQQPRPPRRGPRWAHAEPADRRAGADQDGQADPLPVAADLHPPRPGPRPGVRRPRKRTLARNGIYGRGIVNALTAVLD
jgi:hypothetical protein